MNPLKFKVKKLWTIPKTEKGMFYHQDENMMPRVLAYQLTPEYRDFYVDEKLISHYGGITNAMFYGDGRLWQLRVNLSNPTQPFLIPAEHYEQFKQAVHEYNLKHADLPDVKVLDGYKKWLDKRLPTTKEVIPSEFNEMKALVEEYKATLVSPDMWFEMEGE